MMFFTWDLDTCPLDEQLTSTIALVGLFCWKMYSCIISFEAVGGKVTWAFQIKQPKMH